MLTVQGIHVNCLNGLLILAAFFFALAGFFGICGGVMFGTARMFTVVSNTHLVNRTSASSFTSKIDAGLDSLRKGSAERGKMLTELAMIMFYVTGGLAVPGIICLLLAAVEACRGYMNAPVDEAPSAPVTPSAVSSNCTMSDDSASCCATTCCPDSETCCALTCAAPGHDSCCRAVCCHDYKTCC